VTLEIRKAIPEDASTIVEVLDHADFLNDCYRGEAGISFVKDNTDIIWLAGLDGQVVSVMVVHPDLGGLKIKLIVTRPGPEFERHGYARALTRKAKQIAADDKVDLVAYIENENEKSKNLLITEDLKLDGKSADGLPRYIFWRETH
jgi:hypothetical protein